MAGFDQGGVRAGVEPGEAAAENLDEEVATFEIGVVDVGYFDFAARRRADIGHDVEHVIIK